MISDRLLYFADPANGFANSGVTANVGSTIDLQASRDIGLGTTVWVCVTVTTAFAGSGASVEFKVVSDDSATPAVNGTATLHATFGVKAIAALPVGARFFVALPAIDGERYLGLQATSTGANTTAGAVKAWITDEQPLWKPYSEALN